jgi:nucleotide-binding universal stress UspA family protein
MATDEVESYGRIVVGVDASPESVDALRLARLLAAGLGSEIDVVAVLPGGRAGPNLLPDEEAREAYFQPLFETASDELQGDFTEHRLDGVSAPGGLTSVAERVDAAAIVIGSHARGPIGRVLMGDVGATLAAGAPCGVVVAPRGYARECPETIARVGIGYDGRSESEAALDAGTRMARSFGASPTLVAAVPLLHAGGRIGHTSRGYEHLIIEKMGQRLAEVAGAQEASVDFDVRVGDPADCLAEASEEFDLLVLSSRGYGPLRRVMLGGVSVRVMRSAACPVLVVPRTGRHE